MIELAFIACLSTSPATCRTEALLFADLPLMTCLVRGQAQLAAWASHHPEREVKRCVCELDTRKNLPELVAL